LLVRVSPAVIRCLAGVDDRPHPAGDIQRIRRTGEQVVTRPNVEETTVNSTYLPFHQKAGPEACRRNRGGRAIDDRATGSTIENPPPSHPSDGSGLERSLHGRERRDEESAGEREHNRRGGAQPIPMTCAHEQVDA
jgi:hypothetical protein